MIFFTMIFHAGLILTYLVVISLNLLDTFWAIVFPAATSAFTILVIKTFFHGHPEGLVEAARIDGAGEFTIVISLSVIYLNDTSRCPAFASTNGTRKSHVK
jgi:putative aldouronate transport system permease protein